MNNCLRPDTPRGTWRVLVAAWRNYLDWQGPADFGLLLLPILWTGAQMLGLLAIFALAVGAGSGRSAWTVLAASAATGALGLLGGVAAFWVLGLLEHGPQSPQPPPASPAPSEPDLPPGQVVDADS